MNFADDDFFSPIRHVTSDSDSSVDSENSRQLPSPDMTGNFVKASKEKRVSHHNKTNCGKETDELGSCLSESSFASKPEDSNICTPLSKRNSNKSKRDSKAQSLDFGEVKLGKEKHLKDIKKESSLKRSEDQPKKEECKQSKDTTKYDAVKSNSKQNYVRKHSSRPTSLSLSTKEGSDCKTTKDLKKEKNVTESSKNHNLDVLVSSAKHSEKMLIDNSLKARGKNYEVFNEKSSDSNSCKSLICSSSHNKSDTSSKKSGINQSAENSKSTTNMPVNSPFEISVEKIVHDLISSECDKIRQNMYAQQMSYYRELNKVKEEMKRQHLADNESMLQVIKELMQMNSFLKSMF